MQLAAVAKVLLRNNVTPLPKANPDILIDKRLERGEEKGGGKVKVSDIARRRKIISSTISGYTLFLKFF